MKHLVSYSGGVCSFWAAHRVIQAHGPGPVTLLFADTRIEDEDLYRFNLDVEKALGVPITTIADGRTPWEVFHGERMIGNTRADPCSKILKRELLWRWIGQNCSPQDTVIYLGLDWTEEHRLAKVRQRQPQWTIRAPMIEEPLWDKAKMLAELQALGLDRPRLYDMGFPHNNCGGFCVRAGQAHFALLLRTLPERYAFHEEQEEKLRTYLGKDVAILRDRRNGKTRPMTLREFRERLIANGQYDPNEWGGCGCGH
jgi:hypothetical protein